MGERGEERGEEKGRRKRRGRKVKGGRGEKKKEKDNSLCEVEDSRGDWMFPNFRPTCFCGSLPSLGHRASHIKQ